MERGVFNCTCMHACERASEYAQRKHGSEGRKGEARDGRGERAAVNTCCVRPFPTTPCDTYRRYTLPCLLCSHLDQVDRTVSTLIAAASLGWCLLLFSPGLLLSPLALLPLLLLLQLRTLLLEYLRTLLCHTCITATLASSGSHVLAPSVGHSGSHNICCCHHLHCCYCLCCYCCYCSCARCCLRTYVTSVQWTAQQWRWTPQYWRKGSNWQQQGSR